jgi:cell division protein FtsA
MREQQIGSFVGLDIGTSRVRCVVGTAGTDEPGGISIIGTGSSTSVGLRKGVVVHVEDVAEAVAQAVTEAERVSGTQINSATVNINGVHVVGMNSRGVIAISAANREITEDDRRRAEEAAQIVKLPANREIVQVFAKDYRLDGQDNIKDPVGMRGVRLEVDTHIVTASTPNVRSLDLVLERTHIRPTHRTVSGLAAAEAVLNRQQKESGTVLIDIGAGTTNVVIIEDGEIQHVAVMPIGGMHITNDLAIGLKTELDIAERVKIEHASLDEKQKQGVITFKSHGKINQFSQDDVDKELKKIHRSRKLPGGAVLVGGTAKLPGIADYCREKLQLAARVGKIRGVAGLVDTVQDPEYATAVGLMMLDVFLAAGDSGDTAAGGGNVFGMFEGVMHKFKKFKTR